MNRYALSLCSLLASATGCFDSLVDNPCATGFSLVNGSCVVSDNDRPDGGGGGDDDVGGGTDGGDGNGGGDGGDGSGSGSDGGVGDGGGSDAGPVCQADLETDPDNCGACGHVCATGLCTNGHCEGDLSGHIVAIGHDYQSHHFSMARVLGNAAALGEHRDLAIALYRGTGTAAGVHQALGQGLNHIGRPFHWVTLPTVSPTALSSIDVLIVEPQTGNGVTAQASGAQWATAVDNFLQNNGVVIVLEGAGGVSHRFAYGANLYNYTPVTSTNVPAMIVDHGDSVAQQVLSPYLAETTSVAYPGAMPVVAAPNGDAVVFHTTKY